MSESLRARAGWMPVLLVVAGLAVTGMIAYSIVASSASPVSSTSSTSVRITKQMSSLLEVNPLMTLDTPAPAFTLTDQHGKSTSLASFAGHAVVLTFGDDKCTDLCTLLAEDVLAADKDLGSNASQIQFVSINANTFYPSVAATRSWTDSHGLAHTANWHFLTGTPSVLTALAKRYGVDVVLHHSSRTIDHGAELFFLSPGGHEEQIGEFGTQSANTAEFSHAMAQLATELLPSDRQADVRGPSSVTPAAESTALGARPAPIELPTLDGGSAESLAADRGKFLVVSFWSPTCTLCRRELPAIEQAYRTLGSSMVFVGIDVADPASAGRAFASALGATYPMLSDKSGIVAAQYQVPGLPFTVIFDPQGRVVVRHPGEMTTEQLDYILETLKAES